MAAYWVTFRVHDEIINNRTYSQRYNDFVNEVDALSSKWWTVPTSFIAFESIQSIDTLAMRLKAKIAPSKDVFLLRAMNSQDARIVGNNTQTSIYDFMPDYLKNV